MGGALLPSRAGPDGWLAPVCGLRGLHCHAGTSCHACRARPISTWCTCVGGTATHSGWLLPDHCLCPLRAPHLPPPSGASWHVAAGSPPLPPPNFPSPPGAEHAGSGAGHPTPSPSLVLTPLGLTPPPPTPPPSPPPALCPLLHSHAWVYFLKSRSGLCLENLSLLPTLTPLSPQGILCSFGTFL